MAPRNIRIFTPPADPTAWTAEIIVGVTLHNQARALRRCLSSVFEQTGLTQRLAVVVLDDGSKDEWQSVIAEFGVRPELIVIQGNCGSAARSRNAVLDFVDRSFAQARWIARLDADDRFTCPASLAAACSAGDARKTRFVLGGNRLVRDGQVLGLTNPASPELLTADHCPTA